MDVQLTPHMQAKLDQWTNATGRAQGEFVLDALAGYIGDVDALRDTLDSRYDELRGGKVQLIDGEEALARLRAKSEARRNGSR